VPFRDWDEEDYTDFHDAAFEQIFDNIEGVYELDQNQLREAEALFEAGWLTWGGEYTLDEIQAIRGEFYDLVGMYEEEFDWEEFRELYDAI
jgi:hypothetical protein